MKVAKPPLSLPSRMPKVYWVRTALKADVEYRTMTTAGRRDMPSGKVRYSYGKLFIDL